MGTKYITMKHWLNIITFLIGAVVIKYFLANQILDHDYDNWLKIITVILIFYIGIAVVFKRTTNIIEETTDALKERTGLAGGFLQSFGTAFPDMVLGVVAALMSLSLRDSDYARAINLAIIAAATTFGSNIYNIYHAAWCIWRQNIADKLGRVVKMFPGFGFGGSLKPLQDHPEKPHPRELDRAVLLMVTLTFLTTVAALSMVIFGRVKFNPVGIEGDLYQLKQSLGIFLFILCVIILFLFRKGEKLTRSEAKELSRYHHLSNWRIWLDLALAGIGILFAAESMVTAMEAFSDITGMPFVITGIAAGIIGCLGEMIVVHNFTVNPHGRIGDAVVGVAMDNIVTTLGASIVAIMGGVFLGGNSLIIIFIVIMSANTFLIYQLYQLRNTLSKL
jgi:Ca2+/Na+ antiporter